MKQKCLSPPWFSSQTLRISQPSFFCFCFFFNLIKNNDNGNRTNKLMDWSSLTANQWTSAVYENLNNTFTSPSTSAFDVDQFNTIQLLSKFSAAASFFGSLTIVLTFIIFPRLRSTNNRLILFLSINDTMGSVAFFIGRWTVESRNIGFCFFQAYILQQVSSSNFMYIKNT